MAAGLLGLGASTVAYAGFEGLSGGSAGATTTVDSCGYPTDGGLSSTVFNENSLARAIDYTGSGSSARILAWANDENGILLGANEAGQPEVVTPNTASPQHASSPSLNLGHLSAVDPAGRPYYPAIYVTNLGAGPPPATSTPGAGDWQAGGAGAQTTPHVDDVWGTWAVGRLNSSGIWLDPPTPPFAKNAGWNLGSPDPVPGSLGRDEKYATEFSWNASGLNDDHGNMVTAGGGNWYRFQVILHDGDQHKVGGDVGELCVNMQIPPIPSAPTLTVEKLTDPPGAQGSWSFSVNNGGGTFPLTSGSSKTLSLEPGTYTVHEGAVSGNSLGFDLTDISCAGAGSNGDVASRSLADGSVNVTLHAGDNVTCAFTNTEHASLIVKKATNPSQSTQTFGFSATGPNDQPVGSDFSLGNGETHTLSDLPAGAYKVTEDTLPTGWSLTSVTCDDPDVTPSVQGLTATIALIPGAGDSSDNPAPTCTFTNTYSESPPTTGSPPTTFTPPPPPPPGPVPGQIGLTKSGPHLVHVGDTIVYSFAATNPGTVNLSNVVLSDPICDAAPTVVSKTGGNQDNILNPGEVWTYTCNHLVKASDPNPIVNTASVTGTDPTGASQKATANHVVDIIHPAVTIVKSVNPNSGPPGTPVTYTYVVTNTGDVALAPVTVTDDHLGPVGTLPSLGVGQSGTLTLPSVIGSASVTNIGTAVGTDPLGATVSAAGTATTTAVLGTVVTQPPTTVPPATVPPVSPPAPALAFTGPRDLPALLASGFGAILTGFVILGLLRLTGRRGTDQA